MSRISYVAITINIEPQIRNFTCLKTFDYFLCQSSDGIFHLVTKKAKKNPKKQNAIIKLITQTGEWLCILIFFLVLLSVRKDEIVTEEYVSKTKKKIFDNMIVSDIRILYLM